MNNQIEREELFDWVESHHYKSDLVYVMYKVVGTDVLDCWTMEFDTGDTVFIYGYPDEKFGLQWNGAIDVDRPNDHPMDYRGMAHRIKGIINDAFWRGME